LNKGHIFCFRIQPLYPCGDNRWFWRGSNALLGHFNTTRRVCSKIVC